VLHLLTENGFVNSAGCTLFIIGVVLMLATNAASRDVFAGYEALSLTLVCLDVVCRLGPARVRDTLAWRVWRAPLGSELRDAEHAPHALGGLFDPRRGGHALLVPSWVWGLVSGACAVAARAYVVH